MQHISQSISRDSSPFQSPNAAPMISVLAVVDNDAAVINQFIDEATHVLGTHFRYYELVLIDNASIDGTYEHLLMRLETTPNIHLIRLSGVRDIEVAITAALENCIGDYAVLMDVCLDPPTEIPQLVEQAIAGFDVVIAHRRGIPAAGLGRRMFYRFASRVLGQEMHPEASYFRVLSRSVVVALTKIKNRRRYLRYFNALVGYRQKHLFTQVVQREGASTRHEGIFRAAQKAADLIISNSAAPLRWATLLGICGSLGSMLYLGYSITVALVKDHIAEGWLTTSVVMSSMFFCMFVILSILSEYIARILEESQERPLYFVEFEKNSPMTANRQDNFVNVV